jgi:hypothetical protein
MKNKGRRHKAGNGNFIGICNCKGCDVVLTRPINSMSSRSESNFKISKPGISKVTAKRAWQKRIRGCFKNEISSIKLGVYGEL